MTPQTFKALVVEEEGGNTFRCHIRQRTPADLPDNDLLIRVLYSSLNYKDVLSATGNRGVTRRYPHTPGIDAAGIVEQSRSSSFSPGDEVLVSCYDLGMNTPGGFGQYIRVPAAWVMKRPDGLSLRNSMIYGTAGFTAAQCVNRLGRHPVSPDQGKILVTGATGGVGSMAVAMLAKLGYQVAAATGKKEQAAFLQGLGAAEIVPREKTIDTSDRMLLKAKWAGVVDTVGGNILATAVKSTRYGGAVTCCGNVASADLPLNVYPFILRGVALVGIDSAECPMDVRLSVWRKISREWRVPHLEKTAKEIGLDELEQHIHRMEEGKLSGRTLVNLWR